MYHTLLVPTGDENKAKILLEKELKKLGVQPGQVVLFGKVEKEDKEYNPSEAKHKLVYNDGYPDGYEPVETTDEKVTRLEKAIANLSKSAPKTTTGKKLVAAAKKATETK